MNLVSNKNKQRDMHEDTDFTVQRSRSSKIIAAVLCILLAVLVWLVVIQLEQTDTFKLSLNGAPEQYICVLSDTMIDVKGTALALREIDTIQVTCPKMINAPGTYQLTVGDLHLPEGVTLAEELVLTLTVLPK